MTTARAEKYRRPHPAKFAQKPGDPYGWFEVPTTPAGPKLHVMAAPTDELWQHVSVSLWHRCPTWEEMCKVKDLFWDEEDVCVQYHPPKSEYVSFAKYCLHIWRCMGQPPMPRPPSMLVGPITGGEK